MSSSTRRVAHGLPTNPRSRQPRPVSPGSHHYEESRPLRTMAAPRTVNPLVQREQAPDGNRKAYQTRQRDNYHEGSNVRRSGDSSSTSSSETESSFWSRGNSSQRSSRTTLQSDEGMVYSEFDRETQLNDSPVDNSHPYPNTVHVWTRVAEVANVFTQEVSKVWATGLGNGADDEEDDCHLINVMRAYHLSKARTPSELPDWLFSERERGQGGLLRLDLRNEGGQVKAEPAQPAQRRNLPEIGYQGSTSSLGTHSKATMPSGQAKISGADRLKQMRSLRRTAPTY